MDIATKLKELGMVELSRGESVGFQDVVTSTLSLVVQRILMNHFNLPIKPDIAVIRGGDVIENGGKISRVDPSVKMRYSLAYYDYQRSVFQPVLDGTGKSVTRVLSSMNDLLVGNGKLFIAKKYVRNIKKAQD